MTRCSFKLQTNVGPRGSQSSRFATEFLSVGVNRGCNRVTPTNRGIVPPNFRMCSQSNLSTPLLEVEASKPQQMKLGKDQAAPPPIKRSPKKSVSFDQAVRCRLVSPIKSTDGFKLWFTADEIAQIKEECRKIVDQMDALDYESLPDDLEFCERGLECRTRELAERRRMRRCSCAIGIFEEQQYQFEAAAQDNEFLRRLYITLSGAAAQEAFTQALHDEREAMEYCLSRLNDDDVHHKKSTPTNSSKSTPARAKRSKKSSKRNKVVCQAA